LLGLAAKNMVKGSMELGGNAPRFVLDDADVERAVDGAVKAKLRNGGQSCIAANRIFVQEGIAEEFVAGFTEAMSRVVMGNPLADGVTLDRKSTRLNSSHVSISYAVFCLKEKRVTTRQD